MWRAERTALVALLLAAPARLDAGCDTTLSACVGPSDADSSFAYITVDWIVQPVELSGGEVCAIELPLWAGTYGDTAQAVTVRLQTAPTPGTGVIGSGTAPLATRETVSVSMDVTLPDARATYYVAVSGDGDRSPLWKRGFGCDETGALFEGEVQPWNMAYRIVGTDPLPVVVTSWSTIKALHRHLPAEEES